MNCPEGLSRTINSENWTKVMRKRYILFLDILGFQDIGEQLVSAGHHTDAQKARDDFLFKPLNNEISKACARCSNAEVISGYDDFSIICDDIEDIYDIIATLSVIKIPPKDFGFIPLQMAIGTVVNNHSSVNPISRTSVIRFLKTDLLKQYREYCKSVTGNSVKDSFVLVTNEVYDGLDGLEMAHIKKIPYEDSSIQLFELDYLRERGRTINFCNGLKLPKRYSRINELYVKPLNYNQIKKNLEKNKIILIVGEPESGKTYTAIRLMFEYSHEGFNPIYIAGRMRSERIKSSQLLADLSDGVVRGHIIYFEDPFGKNYYERNEILEREFLDVLKEIERVHGTYIIVTSRSEVYKEFSQHQLSLDEFLSFCERLSFQKEYDYERRAEMLHKWAHFKKCQWISNNQVSNSVFDLLMNNRLLPTPLTIRSFAIQSFNTSSIQKLRKIVEVNSLGTARAFAEEIKQMSDDKILFLCFLLVSDELEKDVLESKYTQAAKELELLDYWPFERVLSWFTIKDDKLDYGSSYKNRPTVKFSHPSFYDALQYILADDGYPTRINRLIFTKVIDLLHEIDEIKFKLAKVIIKNLNVMTESSRNILFKMFSREQGRIMILSDLIDNQKSVNENDKVLNEILNHEGTFLVNMLNKGPNEVQCVPQLDWNVVLDYLIAIESETLKNLSSVLLANIDNSESLNVEKSFYRKLVNRTIDEKISEFVRDSPKAVNDIISHLQSNEVLSNVKSYARTCLTSDYIKKKLQKLKTKKWIRNPWGRPDIFRAGKKLLLRVPSSASTSSIDKTIGLLKKAALILPLPEDVLEKSVNLANRTVPAMQGRRPRVIAAGILYLLVRQEGLNKTVNDVSTSVGVNPATTIKLWREVAGLNSNNKTPR